MTSIGPAASWKASRGGFTMDAPISSASDELFELAQILQSDLAKLGVRSPFSACNPRRC